MTKTVAIVGSGFASWGAALVLAGHERIETKIFDIGLTRPEEGDTSRQVPNAKPYNGSYFAYGINDHRQPVELRSERACSSHAFGGHSTVYSGATLYPLDCELYDWPDESRPRDVDYSAVLSKMPMLAEHDDLEGVFKLVPEQSDLSWYPGESGGFSVSGMSRIALTSSREAEDPLQPFCTRDECERMISTGSLKYSNDCYVLEVQPRDGRLELHYWKDGEGGRESFDAVFLGAGCVNTTAIVDRSLNAPGVRNYPIVAPGSMIHALFRFPWKLSNSTRVRQGNNLPEVFLEVYDCEAPHPRSHTQLSAINEQVIETIGARLPGIFRPFVRALRRTIYVGLSAHSGGNREMARLRSCTADDATGSTRQEISITEAVAGRNLGLIRSVRRAVLGHWRTLRMIPVPFGAALADFLRGNRLGGWHFGGTLPMRSEPVLDAECRPSGELKGLDGVFVLDSAAFPSIPGSTVALLSAAHGHRVARGWISRAERCGE